MGFITSKFSNLISDTISFLGSVYDITNSNNNNLINMDFDGDWGVTLPPLATVTNNFKVVISHTTGQAHKGSIVPSQVDIIDGNNIATVYGNGFLTLSKVNDKWIITNKSLFSNYHLEGITKRYDFEDESEITIVHNLGYVPLIEVWIQEGEGHTRANLDIQHDWDNMNTFTVCISSQQSGKIIYL